MGVAGMVGVGLTVVGALVASSAQSTMVAEQTDASQTAENARRQQMQLEAQRRRRQAAREAILARSRALSLGTAAGATGSSGLASAMSGAISQGKENMQNLFSSEALGGRVFDANQKYFNASQKGQAGVAFGQGISSLGGAVVSNSGAIARLGGYA